MVWILRGIAFKFISSWFTCSAPGEGCFVKGYRGYLEPLFMGCTCQCVSTPPSVKVKKVIRRSVINGLNLSRSKSGFMYITTKGNND